MQITHCPQCETAFKVSPQQLELAKGWVRCGRCAHVFEAALYFETLPNVSEPSFPSAEASALLHETVVSAMTANESPPFGEVNQAEYTETTWSLMWLLSAGCLLLGLLMQLLLAQRNWLAAEEPALRSLLSAICACEIVWPREPDAVLIESSSFTESPDGGYTVQLRLKNTQHHTVAMPALELSLTDLQDQVLVRRVFRAQELSDKDHVQALRDVRWTLNFDLDDKVSKHIAGFRAILFYL